ncbi:MAG: iron-siderophore ABC transporter substrate-binding protein [Geminocystis sp.]
MLSECRMVKHEMGESCVPMETQRIVVLDDCTLEPILALDMQPLGAPTDNLNIPYEGDLSNTQDIGFPPNLETIFSLKPDLILGCAYLKDIYEQVSKIAPTVMIPIESSSDWKSVFFLVADTLGKTDKAEQIMKTYTERLNRLRSHLGKRVKSAQISVIRIEPEHIVLYAKDIFIGTVLADAGLSRPPSQNRDVSIINISKESIQDADGDVVFVWTYGSNEKLAEAAEKELKKLQSDPLWQQLKAVKKNKVYVVPDYWIGAGPLSANAVIDDLFEYLVD